MLAPHDKVRLGHLALFLLQLSQPDPGATAVLVDEFNAHGLEHTGRIC